MIILIRYELLLWTYLLQGKAHNAPTKSYHFMIFWNEI